MDFRGVAESHGSIPENGVRAVLGYIRSALAMSPDKLRGFSKTELAEMARKKGIAGWKGMRKDELISALLATSQTKRKKKKTIKVATRSRRPARVRTTPQVAAARNSNGVASSAEEQVESSKYHIGIPTKDLSAKAPKNLPAGYGKDRIVVMVRDPYWLHTYWEITRQSIQRAEAALGQEWHGAKSILRLLDVTSGDITSTAESVVRDIEIHGGCNNWYIDVSNPPRSFRVDIGYLSKSGQFYVLARSNVVSTPRAGVSDVIDENWADIDTKKADRIYAMSGGFDPNASSLELKQLFEERLRRPLGSPTVTSFGSGAFQFGKERKFWFQLDAELIVYGATEPTARVTLQGEPVKLRPDGTFTMRFSLPDSRQIIPAVAASADGVEERTIVLAVERNTKVLEPLLHETNE
jgi:hypothetical protein